MSKWSLALQAFLHCSVRSRTDTASLAGCRYSAFIPLYPLGILGGEMPLIWTGLPYMRQRKLHSTEMPNSMNFAFSYPIFAQVRHLGVMSLEWESVCTTIAFSTSPDAHICAPLACWPKRNLAAEGLLHLHREQ